MVVGLFEMGTLRRAYGGRMGLMEEEPHCSFERKELKGSRRYPLVKPLSPSQLVGTYGGSVLPSMHSPVGEHFIMTARFRLLPPRTGGFLCLTSRFVDGGPVAPTGMQLSDAYTPGKGLHLPPIDQLSDMVLC